MELEIKELNLKELDVLDSDTIDNMKVEGVKMLDIAQNQCSLVEQDYQNLQLKIINIQREKKEKEIMLSKAKQVIRTLNAQIKILESKFFQSKRR